MKQTGPGMTGTLSPFSSTSSLVLQSETAILYLDEDKASLELEFILYNPKTFVVKEKVGIPSLSIEGSTMSITINKATFDGRPLDLTVEATAEKPDFNFSEFLPFIQTFGLSHRWHTTPIALFGESKAVLEFQIDVPYLHKVETFQGRKQVSRKLLRYVRKHASPWKGVPTKAAVYAKPRLAQPKRMTLTPIYRPDQDGTLTFEFNGYEPTASQTVTMIYDPIELNVTSFGWRDQKPPRTLKTHPFENLFDQDTTTAWCEGEKGVGQWKAFEVEWGKSRRVTGVEIVPGISSNSKLFRTRNRPKKIHFYISSPGWVSERHVHVLDDKAKPQKVFFDFRDPATLLIVQLVSAYPGSKKNDTCIAEIRPLFTK